MSLGRAGGPPERGGATVLAAAVVAVLVVVGAAAVWLAGAVRAAHHARSAADLTALAAATSAQRGPGEPCATAAALAAANDARLESCVRADDGSVTVRVTVRVPLVAPGLPGRTVARARAGPAP